MKPEVAPYPLPRGGARTHFLGIQNKFIRLQFFRQLASGIDLLAKSLNILSNFLSFVQKLEVFVCSNEEFKIAVEPVYFWRKPQ